MSGEAEGHAEGMNHVQARKQWLLLKEWEWKICNEGALVNGWRSGSHPYRAHIDLVALKMSFAAASSW